MAIEYRNVFEFVCAGCGHVAPQVRFVPKTGCEACGCVRVEARYPEMTRELFDAMLTRRGSEVLWRYFPVLPLADSRNIIKAGEGGVPIDRWRFLERFAERHRGIRLTVFAHRHDCQPATGSVKDLAAALVASALRENRLAEYVVCSTGNTSTAFASYLSRAGITLHAFLPEGTPPLKEAEIGYFGQNVYRVQGDYAVAKQLAEVFAIERQLPLTGGNFDPFRIEAKRTTVFHWLRKLERFPDVYIQAVSGGTGPLAVDKACRELMDFGYINRPIRMVLSQPDRCDPMATAWRRARAAGFPDGWQDDYPVLENPESAIFTLATGNPANYPFLAPIVRASGGSFHTVPEELAAELGRVVAFEKGAFIGPAAAIGVGGFFAALKDGALRDGDLVIIAVGDSIHRDPDFLLERHRTPVSVRYVSDCVTETRAEYGQRIWAPIDEWVD